MAASNPYRLLDVLGQLEKGREATSPNSGIGQRKFTRFVVRGEAELRAMDRIDTDAGSVQVLLRDIGRGGVGFVSQEKLATNSIWRLCFYQHGYMIGHQAVIVKHSREIEPGVYLAGGQFCIESGLLALLGVDPAIVRNNGDLLDKDLPDTHFDSPADVA